MASIGGISVAIALLVLSIQGPLGNGYLECENLPKEFCAFSVSSSGARCVLEKKYYFFVLPTYKCKSSSMMAQRTREWIESEKCVRICGLQRMSVGMSSDDINYYSIFSSRLCSDNCQNNCPNVQDLYFTLTANKGLYLPHLCEVHKQRSQRSMLQNQSGSGDVDIENENENVSALAPAPTPMTTNAPTPAPNMNAPLSGPAQGIKDALTPAPTMGVD